MTNPKALREMCEPTVQMTVGEICDYIIACGCRIPKDTLVDLFATARREGAANALQIQTEDRLSGEAVTRERINQILRQHIRIEDDSEEWESPQPRTAGIDKAANAILSLLPAGMDRNAVIEECALVADAADPKPEPRDDDQIARSESWQANEIAARIRALKSS